jgi:hypothetical protein
LLNKATKSAQATTLLSIASIFVLSEPAKAFARLKVQYAMIPNSTDSPFL